VAVMVKGLSAAPRTTGPAMLEVIFFDTDVLQHSGWT
jgi:hypothetical protein